ncbi:MAG: SDR family NAD(P)-dependent oxidoreductase [Deltaproteobacteria bacterium]|nr:SDR family NAD(P)-dependent oxidoreductase [Deltaproteobacteria bacterium]
MFRPSLRLDGKTALVTGAASGLGRRLATDLFREHRCRLILVDRDETGLRSLAEELDGDARPKREPRVTCLTADTTDDEAIRRIADHPETSSIDVIVNCAGVLYAGPFESMPPGAFERVIDINLMGTVRVTRALLPNLLRGVDPVLVNVASAAGLAGAPGMCAYATSKFGVVGFSESLRAELDRRVTVVAVCPTLIATNIVAAAQFPADVGAAKGKMDRVLARHGMPVEKASALILRGVIRRRRTILIGNDAHVMDVLRRFAPGLLDRTVARMYRRMRERKLVPS